MDVKRTYYEGVDGPVWVTHEERGPGRVTSRLVIDDWCASWGWPPGTARAIQESPEARHVREFAASATRHLVAEAIAAGRLPAERCDHLSAVGLCTRRWTIEVAYDRVRLHRCAEHGHRFYRAPGPSALSPLRLVGLVPGKDFERVTTRGDGI